MARLPREYTCEVCGKAFISRQKSPRSCSRKCKAVLYSNDHNVAVKQKMEILHGETKFCPGCGKEKPIIEFKAVSGLAITKNCRSCINSGNVFYDADQYKTPSYTSNTSELMRRRADFHVLWRGHGMDPEYNPLETHAACGVVA